MRKHGFAEKLHQKEKWSPDEFGTFCASHNHADLHIFDRLISFDFSKEGNREDFVKIGKAPVRLPRIIHGGECFLPRALFILAEGPIWQACTNSRGVYCT